MLVTSEIETFLNIQEAKNFPGHYSSGYMSGLYLRQYAGKYPACKEQYKRSLNISLADENYHLGFRDGLDGLPFVGQYALDI